MDKHTSLQEDIINKTISFYKNNTKGYLNLAMRIGKTRITLEVLKRLKYENKKVLIAYPDNKLKQNWKDECIKWKYDDVFVTYINFSSIKKHVNNTYDFFICDEFHSLSENEKELSKKINSQFYLFLSGTISEDTKLKWPEFLQIFEYSTELGIINNLLADYQITVHTVLLDDLVKTKDKKGKLRTEKQRYDAYTWVIEKMKDENRNFMHLALARNRLSLSSLGKTNYLKGLLKKLSDKRVVVFTGLSKVADEIGIPSYHSKSPNDDAFTGFQRGEHNHLALAAMGKVGVTYKGLDSVILLNFTYNAEETSQILNRAIKLDYKSKVADLHIICLSEKAELKKIKESLSMLDATKIKYV
jgi:superfamily II DNA or RNA helicase